MSNNENLFKELEKRYTGKKDINNNFMENYDTLSRYTDNFVCDIKDQREFSKFNEEFPEHSLNLTDLYNYSKSFIIKDYEINNNMTNRSLVEASLTLRNITYWMNIAKYNHNNTNRKYFKYVAYSVDENTIGAFEGLMCRLFNLPIEYIDYADTRALELYNDTKNNDLYVKYMKGNNWYKKKMKYSYFRSIVYNNSKTMNYYNVTKFCEFGETKGKNYDINLGGASLMIILSVLDGVLIVLLILFCAKKSR